MELRESHEFVLGALLCSLGAGRRVKMFRGHSAAEPQPEIADSQWQIANLRVRKGLSQAAREYF